MAAPEQRLQARWAWMGKRSGDMLDYRVLASSGDSSQYPTYERLIRSYNPGTPSREEAGDPGALPWVTFSPALVADEHWSGITVQRWSDEHDGTGQRIASTWYYSASYEQVADRRATFASLYAGVDKLPEPVAGDGPVELRVAAGDLTKVAATVDELGFEWVATVATLLLQGPVALVDAGPLPLEQRLACLDAIMALLPYGFRAELSASSWADGGVRHQIYLTFANYARPGQQEVRWRASGYQPKTRPAADYLTLLRRVHERVGALAMVRHLAEDRAPSSFAEPDAAVASLGAMARALFVWQSVSSNRADPDDVRRLLAEGVPTILRPRELRDIYAFVLNLDASGLSTPDDLRVLARHWSEELLDALGAFVGRSLAVRGLTQYLSDCAAMADSHGAPEAFLSRVLDNLSVDGGGRLGVQAGAELLLLWRPPAPGTWAPVRDRLLRLSPLVAELLWLETSAKARDRLVGWLAWLVGPVGRVPAWLRPYQALVADGVPLGTGDLRSLAESDPRSLIVLLDVAEARGRAADAIEAAWEPLVELVTRLDKRDAEHLGSWLDEAPVDAPAWQARVDLLLTLLDRPPQRLLTVGRKWAAPYFTAIGAALGEPALDAVRGKLADRLVRLVDGPLVAPDHGPAERRVALLLVAAEHASPKVRGRALTLAADAINADPGLLEGIEADDRLLLQLEKRSPQLRRWLACTRLNREIQRGVEPETLALLWGEAMGEGCTDADVLALLGNWPHALDPDAVHDLLERRYLVMRDRERRNDAVQRHHDLAFKVMRGDIGPDTADRYRRWVAAKARYFAALDELRAKSEPDPKQKAGRSARRPKVRLPRFGGKGDG